MPDSDGIKRFKRRRFIRFIRFPEFAVKGDPAELCHFKHGDRERRYFGLRHVADQTREFCRGKARCLPAAENRLPFGPAEMP